MTQQPAAPSVIDPADMPRGQYAVVEQLGHATLIGRVAEIERFGAPFLRIEPLFRDMMLPAVLIGGASIYRFTPCPPAAAWNMRPKYRDELPPSVCALIPPEPDPEPLQFDPPAFLGFDPGSEAGDLSSEPAR